MDPGDTLHCPASVLVVGTSDGLGGRLRATLDDLSGFEVTVVGSVEDGTPVSADCIVLTAGLSRDVLAVAAELSEGRSPGDRECPPVVCVVEDPASYSGPAVLEADVAALVDAKTIPDGPVDGTEFHETLESVTETYRKRRQQRRDSSVLDSMLGELPVHMFVKDDQARHVRVSDARHDPADLLGNADHEVWSELSEGTGSHADDLRVLESGESILNKEEYSTIEDEWFLTSKAPWYEDGDIVGLVGLSIEITERKQRQQLLRNTSRLLRAIVHASPLPIVVHAADGSVQLWNAAAEELFGWTEDEVIGDSMPPSVPPEERETFGDLLERASSDGTIPGVDIQGRTRDGDRLDLQLSAATVEPTGEDERIVTIYSDVTELKERERRLRRRKQRIEAFTAVLAHDLRNPLQVIEGQLETIEGPSVDTAAIDRSLNRIEAIVNDVLTLADEEPVVDDSEPTRLSVVASEAWMSPPDATLEVESDCTVRAEPQRLRRLFGHLFENACVHGSTDRPLAVRVGCTDDGFYVADDGVGIDDDEKDRVLEPGYSTSPGETGYGLNIVREIAAAHGWEVSVTDSREGGAEFRFTGVEPAVDSDRPRSSAE